MSAALPLYPPDDGAQISLIQWIDLLHTNGFTVSAAQGGGIIVKVPLPYRDSGLRNAIQKIAPLVAAIIYEHNARLEVIAKWPFMRRVIADERICDKMVEGLGHIHATKEIYEEMYSEVQHEEWLKVGGPSAAEQTVSEIWDED